MTKQIQSLINALREELQQYGEMLALLDQQQAAENLRGTEDLHLTIGAINAQGANIQAARQHRENAQAALASVLAPGGQTSFAQLIPKLPGEYRPLLGALVLENNELLIRVRQRARQNQALFQRSMETLQRFLSSLLANDRPAESNAIPAGPLETSLALA